MGRSDFENYYSEIFKERWDKLRDSLNHSHRICFSVNEPNTSVLNFPQPIEKSTIPRNEKNLLQYYILDPASVLIARALPLTANSKVLDMCAAPGGKSLVLISRLSSDSEIILNEVSPGRREALIKVIQNYVPLNERESRIWVRGQDGVQFGLRSPNSFDSILLDAPCSGEAHILENKSEMDVWSKKRTQGLSIKQYSLLSSAWSAVKSGGSILYSTCTLSPLENDEVIRKLIKRKKDEVEILKPDLELVPEWTEFGFQYLPDKCGMGPLYGCLIKKK
ncbi:MAG: RsmB/NOP family class I SAM-dependent RNA methyltransferase [Bdellovibrionales bacterium]